MVTTRSKDAQGNGAKAAEGKDAAVGSKHKAAQGKDAAVGSKHKMADAEEPDRSTKAAKTRQTTLEETLDSKQESRPEKKEDDDKFASESKSESKAEDEDEHQTGEKDGNEASKPENKPASSGKDTDQDSRSASSILEKGIVYFFFRGRVNIDNPASVNEIARTFVLLRPLASTSSELNAKALPNNLSRLLAVPKKTFPTSGREKWISFVEKTGVSFSDLKESFLSGNEYETKTQGTQHTPPATPVGEGVYAITTTGRDSHLVYMLTIPEELGEVQKEMGLKKRGSFVISTRNPEYAPPGNTSLPEGPEFPEEIKKQFSSRRWCPTNPKHLDVEGAQILLVGESSGIEKATEPPKDQKEGEPDPKEELEKLEEEDEKRMEALSKDDSESIFKDLHASAKDYPKLQTTF